jgi:hypothetical protein
MKDMNDVFNFLLYVGKEDSMPLAGQLIKLAEETGELAEQVNQKLGFTNHKAFKEPMIGEVADVICCAIGVLVKAYPYADKQDLIDCLETHLKDKGKKWEQLEIDRRERANQSVSCARNLSGEPRGND